MKQRISGARQRALLSANEEQIRLYQDLGRDILDRQSREKWGAKVIDHLSADLRSAFPDMKVFAQLGPGRQFGQQSAAQLSQPIADRLPWFHIVTLLTKLTDPALREWYAREAPQCLLASRYSCEVNQKTAAPPPRCRRHQF